MVVVFSVSYYFSVCVLGLYGCFYCVIVLVVYFSRLFISSPFLFAHKLFVFVFQAVVVLVGVFLWFM